MLHCTSFIVSKDNGNRHITITKIIQTCHCEISGFFRGVVQVCPLQGFYTVSIVS